MCYSSTCTNDGAHTYTHFAQCHSRLPHWSTLHPLSQDLDIRKNDDTFSPYIIREVQAPVMYSKPYHLYGVLWQRGDHKRTKCFLTLYYRPKLTFYDQNMKATSSYFILKQSLSPPMKHKYLLFLSKLRTLWIYPHI